MNKENIKEKRLVYINIKTKIKLTTLIKRVKKQKKWQNTQNHSCKHIKKCY